MKYILGDNPFFAVSHLSPDKSSEYLENASLEDTASKIILSSKKYNFETFMLSTHATSISLLKKTGYYDNDIKEFLPDLAINVPNVHTLNSVVASKGLFAGVKYLLSSIHVKSIAQIFNPGNWKGGTGSALSAVITDVLINEFPRDKVKYICIHNILTDLLVGLGGQKILNILSVSISKAGFTPVFLTLNPLVTDKVILDGDVICFYYNKTGYNVCPDLEKIKQYIEDSPREKWLMGILASGAVLPDQALGDDYLKEAEGILYATSKEERLAEFKELTKEFIDG